uniref:Uncharacterized protein n=1 Tax=Anguilla anguilla TaxID=7936 RepID=A0A0E9X1K1_ANGAN
MYIYLVLRLFHQFECCKHTFTKGPLLFNSKFSKGSLCALLPVLRLRLFLFLALSLSKYNVNKQTFITW